MPPAIHDLAILTNTSRPSVFEMEPDPDIRDEWSPVLLADGTLAYEYIGADPVPVDLVGTTIQAWASTPPESGEPLTWKAAVTEVVIRDEEKIIVHATTIPTSLEMAISEANGQETSDAP